MSEEGRMLRIFTFDKGGYAGVLCLIQVSGSKTLPQPAARSQKSQEGLGPAGNSWDKWDSHSKFLRNA